ncbi:uncharacterized protein LOC126335744 [Schistocerca gregaria]|uniref:uncharacterized protein LOC126335744 n=1 Tax=Schistocerca gregaria TaxID=7010 RepID=UPI00211E6151|nr:uncharacterized protein LOC126335744 [Schistocerca gregaria]
MKLGPNHICAKLDAPELEGCFPSSFCASEVKGWEHIASGRQVAPGAHPEERCRGGVADLPRRPVPGGEGPGRQGAVLQEATPQLQKATPQLRETASQLRETASQLRETASHLQEAAAQLQAAAAILQAQEAALQQAKASLCQTEAKVVQTPPPPQRLLPSQKAPLALVQEAPASLQQCGRAVRQRIGAARHQEGRAERRGTHGRRERQTGGWRAGGARAPGLVGPERPARSGWQSLQILCVSKFDLSE